MSETNLEKLTGFAAVERSNLPTIKFLQTLFRTIKLFINILIWNEISICI